MWYMGTTAIQSKIYRKIILSIRARLKKRIYKKRKKSELPEQLSVSFKIIPKFICINYLDLDYFSNLFEFYYLPVKLF